MSPTALIVCRDPDLGNRITQLLDGLGCVCEHTPSIDEALQRIRSHCQGGRHYRLLVGECSAQMPDGARLLDEAKRLDPRTVRCLMVDGDPSTAAHTRGTPAQHRISLPPTTSELKPVVEELLGRESRGRSRTQGEDETPFFGTRRLAPGTASVAVGTGAHHREPAAETPPDPFEDQLREQGISPGADHHRKSTGSHTRVLSSTQRVRRSISGNLSREQEERQREAQTAAIGSDSRHVRCAHCRQGFKVAVRERSYAAPCVHCGGLNTIQAR